jgi:hypothetical protein
VVAALTRALQDNLSNTRATARVAFCAFREGAPAAATALMRRLDMPMQAKLVASMNEYEPGALAAAQGGGGGGEAGASSRPPSNGGSGGGAAAGRPAAAGRAAAAAPPQQREYAREGEAEVLQVHAPPARSALAGGAQRRAVSPPPARGAAARQQQQHAPPPPRHQGPAHHHAPPPERQPQHNLTRESSMASDDLKLDQLTLNADAPGYSAHHAPAAAAAAPRTPRAAHHAHPAAAPAHHHHVAAAAAPPAPVRVSLPRAVAAVAAPSSDWRERVARLDALSDALLATAEAGGFGAAEMAEVEKVLPRLMTTLDDGHFKVGVWGARWCLSFGFKWLGRLAGALLRW